MSASCTCANFANPPHSADDVADRAKDALTIKQTLETLRTSPNGYWKLYRCRECGQYWQSVQWQFTRRGRWRDIPYQVAAVDPDQWDQQKYPDLVAVAQVRSTLTEFAARLGPEVGPARCRSDTCEHMCVLLSVFCAEHHIEQLQKVGALPKWDGCRIWWRE